MFTLPVEFLPKKKKIKVQNSNKNRVPSVGTSDDLYQIKLKEQKEKQYKTEKLEKKKKL